MEVSFSPPNLKMKKLICDECEKEVDRLWTLEAYNSDLEDYLKPSKDLCKKCALKHLENNRRKMTTNKKIQDKKYPEDYTKEERELIKQIVIERIKQTPDNFRISIG